LPFDAFNTVMYQLWLRRHTVRYESIQSNWLLFPFLFIIDK
jgi:hypothetical protein